MRIFYLWLFLQGINVGAAPPSPAAAATAARSPMPEPQNVPPASPSQPGPSLLKTLLSKSAAGAQPPAGQLPPPSAGFSFPPGEFRALGSYYVLLGLVC